MVSTALNNKPHREKLCKEGDRDMNVYNAFIQLLNTRRLIHASLLSRPPWEVQSGANVSAFESRLSDILDGIICLD